MKYLIYILVVLCSFIIISCELFTTRTPEEPDTGGGSFQVPVEPEVVIENFKYAISEKNLQNYIQCFSDTALTQVGFQFIPTAEVAATYPTLFNSWSLDSERRYFNSIINSLETGINPILTLFNSGFSQKLPDSAVYISDYVFSIMHNNETLPKEFTGRMQLTISLGSGGLWNISRWIDARIQSDTIKSTWSLAKAFFYN